MGNRPALWEGGKRSVQVEENPDDTSTEETPDGGDEQTVTETESAPVEGDVAVTDETGDDPLATDAAKERAAALGIDLASVQGTGADGRILKSDVDAHLSDDS